MDTASFGTDGARPSAKADVYPCISLWQPYASLVACGAKPYETRHWAAPARMQGVSVAFHAAMRRPTRAEIGMLSNLVPKVLGMDDWADHVPYGAVVCTAVIVDCRQVRRVQGRRIVFEDGTQAVDDGFGDYGPGRWCWQLGQIRRLRVPLALRGRQGWWNCRIPAELRDDNTAECCP